MIKFFATDVDGTMTDGGMYYTVSGDEFKKFNARDGMGIRLLRESGVKTAIITSENIEIVKRRAEKLKVDFLKMGTWAKLDFIKEVCREYGYTMDEVAYIGDDINDYETLSNVGLRACPADAVEKIKSIDNIIVLNKKGGEGAVREFCEMILKINTKQPDNVL